MRLAHPEALLLLLSIPALALLLWLGWRSRDRALARLLPAGEQRAALSTASGSRRIVRLLLLSLALLFLVVAAARPQLGFDYLEVKRQGVDVVVAIDVSTSMLAQDVVPDRLGRAKHAALRLLDKLGGDRVAVLPFAGSSTLRWPLSFDHGAARMLIEAVDATAVTKAGSGLKTAVEGALKLFTKDERYEKVLVILSDGEDLVGGLDEAGRQAAERKLIIHAIGVGDTRGAPIPLPGAEGEFKRDKSDKIVLTRLEPEPLQVLAGLTGGVYVQASYAEDEVDVVAEKINALLGHEMKKSVTVRYKEQYQWFLLPGLLLVLLEEALGRRRKDKR